MRFTPALILLPSLALAAPQLPTSIGFSVGISLPSEICYVTTICGPAITTSSASGLSTASNISSTARPTASTSRNFGNLTSSFWANTTTRSSTVSGTPSFSFSNYTFTTSSFGKTGAPVITISEPATGTGAPNSSSIAEVTISTIFSTTSVFFPPNRTTSRRTSLTATGSSFVTGSVSSSLTGINLSSTLSSVLWANTSSSSVEATSSSIVSGTSSSIINETVSSTASVSFTTINSTLSTSSVESIVVTTETVSFSATESSSTTDVTSTSSTESAAISSESVSATESISTSSIAETLSSSRSAVAGSTSTTTFILPTSSFSAASSTAASSSATSSSTSSTTISSTVIRVSSTSTASRTRTTSVPAPSGISIRGVNYGGSGCSSGTVSSQLAADRSTLTLLYGAFVAQTGQGLLPSDARKNCQLSIAINYPNGWQFSVFKADYRGYANLAVGQRGVARAAYYFSGQSQQIESDTNIVGPFDNNYLKTDTFGVESKIWSPCGYDGILNINSEVRIAPLVSPNPALMTFDSADLKFTQVHYLAWQKC